MPKVIRYERPGLEIEFDREALVREDCCRFVQVVVRLCGVPYLQNVMLEVAFERVREQGKDGAPHDAYAVHPRHNFLVRKDFPNYVEYALELLARAHSEETGTVRIKMESPSYNVLSEAVFCLDSRYDEPVQRSVLKGSFRAFRTLSRIRTTEERDALRGRYPPSAQGEEGHPPVQLASFERSAEVSTPALFPQD